jgi:hypothetical protein
MTIQQQFQAIVKKFNQRFAVPLGLGLFWIPEQKTYAVRMLDDADSLQWHLFAGVDRIPQLYSDAQAISIARKLPNLVLSETGEVTKLYGNYSPYHSLTK